MLAAVAHAQLHFCPAVLGKSMQQQHEQTCGTHTGVLCAVITLPDPRRTHHRQGCMSQQVVDEVEAASPTISAPDSSSATPLGSSYADLAAAADLEDLVDDGGVAAVDGEQPTPQALDQEVGQGLQGLSMAIA